MGCGTSQEAGSVPVRVQPSSTPVRLPTPPPRTTLACHAWQFPSEAKNFVYPELSSKDFGIPYLRAKPNFGICLPCGGARACAAAWGWSRALQQLGYFAQARYLTASAESIWLAAPLSYQEKLTKDEFLGIYLEPSECTIESVVWNDEGTFGSICAAVNPHAITFKNISKAAGNECGLRLASVSQAIAQAFLAPLELHHQETLVTAAGTNGKVDDRVRKSAVTVEHESDILALKTDSPFPIWCGSLIVPTEAQIFYPLEFTPLYIGCPVIYAEAKPVPIGGGYVEPLAAGSDPPATAPAEFAGDGTEELQVSSPGFWSLATQVALCSTAIATNQNAAATTSEDIPGVSKACYWSPMTCQPAQMLHGDAGRMDGLGVFPLLRRKVSKVLVFVATRVAPTTADAFAQAHEEVAFLFGRAQERKAGMADPINAILQGKTPVAVLNQMLQVFEPTAFDALFADYEAHYKRGSAAFHRATYWVRGCPAMGVPKNWAVEVLWAFNSQMSVWEEKLPADAKAWLTGLRSTKAPSTEKPNPLDAGTATEFPYIPNLPVNYSMEMVGLLSQQCSWAVHELEDQIQELLKC